MSSVNTGISHDLFLDLQSGKSLKDELHDKYNLNGRLDVPRLITDLGHLLSSGDYLKLDKVPAFTSLISDELSQPQKTAIYNCGLKCLLGKHTATQDEAMRTAIKCELANLLSIDVTTIDDTVIQAMACCTADECMASFHALRSLPLADQRSEVFCSLLYLSVSGSDDELEKLTNRLPKDLTILDNTVVQAMAAYTRGGDRNNYVTRFSFYLLDDIPLAHRRPEVLCSLLYYLKYDLQGSDVVDLAFYVSSVPKQERADCLVHTAALLKNVTVDSNAKCAILSAVATIPAHERAEVCQSIPPSLIRILNKKDIVEFFTFIQTLLPAKQVDIAAICTCVQALMPDINDVKSIIAAFKLIQDLSKDEHANLICSLPAILAPLADTHKIDAIEAACNISDLDERQDVCHHVQTLREAGYGYGAKQSGIDGIRIANTCGHSIKTYFQVVRSIPKAERTDFCKQTVPLIQYLGEIYASTILQEIAAIDARERESFCTQVAPLIAPISHQQEQCLVVNTLASMDKDDRADVIAQVKPLLKDLRTYGGNASGIMAAVSQIPQKERALLIAQAEQLIVGITQGRYRVAILNTLKDLSVAERAAFVQQALPLVAIENEQRRVQFLQVLGQLALPAPTMPAPVQPQAPLVDPDAVDQDEALLKALAKVLPEERIDVIIRTESMLAKCMDLAIVDTSAAFLAVAQIPREQCEEVCQYVAAFLSHANFSQYLALLEAIAAFPVEECSQVIQQVTHIAAKEKHSTKNLETNPERIVTLLKSMQSIALKERTPAVMEALENLVLSEFYGRRDFKVVPEGLNRLPLEQRGPYAVHAAAHYCEATTRFLKGYISAIYWKDLLGEDFDAVYTGLSSEKDRQWTIDERLSLALVLTFTPATERPHALEIMKEKSIDKGFLVLKILTLQPQDRRNAATFDMYLSALNNSQTVSQHDSTLTALLLFIPPQHLEEAIELLDQPEFRASSDPTLKAAMSLLLARESFKEAIYSYLQSQLVAQTSAAEKWQLVQLIEKNKNLLQLHDEHYLLQQAEIEGTLCAPGARNNPKNPYRIYGDLRATLTQEALFDIAPEGSMIEGETIVWDVTKLRALNISKSRTFADLPKGLTFATLQQHFTRLEARLQALPEDERAQVHHYIEQSMGDETNAASLAKFKSELLDKPFIPSLFVQHAKPDDPISASTFQLYTILQALGEADDTLAPGQVLTEREEMLLRLGASVQACDRGQKEGLAKFYNTLPQAVSLGVAAIDEGAESIMWHVVDTGVQETLKNALDNEAPLELGDANVMKQGVHNSTYLKNRYHLQLGFKHKLEFDTHTGVLDDKILAMAAEAPKEAVEIIFRYATPEKAHRQVMLVANRIFVQENAAKAEAKQKGEAFKGRSLYSAIDELAQQAKKGTPYFIGFKYDDADECMENPIEQLTPAGALFFIKKRGTMRNTD